MKIRRTEMDQIAQSLESVKEYYGKILNSSSDLKTSACCPTESMPAHLREILKDIHDEVKDKFYGCGSPIPHALEAKTVLDLGSGTGRDCFILSKLVGPRGRVIGVDMTEEQIEVAERHMSTITEQKFGFLRIKRAAHQRIISKIWRKPASRVNQSMSSCQTAL
jgi:arsenite methyltransferase